MTKKDRIQCLLITHLLKHGEIQLALPGGTRLTLGITQLGKRGKEICEDYCWVQTEQNERTTYIDTYNVGVTCPQNKLVFVGEDEEGMALDII
jgi:hypothetical protein